MPACAPVEREPDDLDVLCDGVEVADDCSAEEGPPPLSEVVKPVVDRDGALEELEELGKPVKLEELAEELWAIVDEF